MKTIGDIAAIRLGVPFRERIAHDSAGKYLVVQGKDIGVDGALLLDGMVKVGVVPGKGRPDTLSPGELVFQTRGLSYRAATVPRDAPPMVAAGSLFILRPNPSAVTADYLAFFLNLPTTQTALRQLATGSTIPNLRRAVIEQLGLPVPPLADQHKLVALGDLVRRQAAIAGRLNILRLQELQLLAAARAGCDDNQIAAGKKRRPATAATEITEIFEGETYVRS